MSSYESHVTTSAIFDKPAKIIYPFAAAGDLTTKEIHQPLVQLADRYAPPTLGAAFVPATDANFSGSPVSTGSAYCIGDTEPQEIEAGLVSFVRRWANVPATRKEYPGSTAYAFPQVANETTGTSSVITSITGISGSVATFNVTAHGILVGGTYRVNIRNTDKTSYSTTGVATAVTTNSFTGPYKNSGTFSLGYVWKSTNLGSGSRTRNVPTWQISEYILPGVTAGYATVDSIQPFEPFGYFDQYGNAGSSGITTTTTPSKSEYYDMAASGVGLVVSSSVERWKEPIYVRRTIYVRAL
jgi:hypothetical protein